MALLSCKSSAVVAGGGMLSPHRPLQVCVLNTHTVDKCAVITCIQDGGGLYSTYSFSQSCHFCLLMRQRTQLALLSEGEKSRSDCLSAV